MARSKLVKRTTDAVQLPSLDPNSRLWHIMPTMLKLKTFLQGGFWFARLDQFGAPDVTLEGALPAQNLGLLRAKLPGAQVPDAQKEYALGIQRAYASCWHINDDKPSNHAWSTFGRGNGVALRTDAITMRSQLASISGSDGPVYIAPVRYITHEDDFIQDGNVIAATFAIRDDYSDERELRALIYTHGTAANNQLLNKRGKYGPLVHPTTRNGITELEGAHCAGRAIVVKIEPREFIHEIMIQPGAGWLTRCRITCLLRWYGLRDRLRN